MVVGVLAFVVNGVVGVELALLIASVGVVGGEGACGRVTCGMRRLTAWASWCTTIWLGCRYGDMEIVFMFLFKRYV